MTKGEANLASPYFCTHRRLTGSKLFGPFLRHMPHRDDFDNLTRDAIDEDLRRMDHAFPRALHPARSSD